MLAAAGEELPPLRQGRVRIDIVLPNISSGGSSIPM